MGTYILTEPEKSLFAAIQHGDRVEIGTTGKESEIRAEVLQHFILGLPVVEKKGVLQTVGSWLGVSSRDKACRIASVGFSIRGGIVTGRLILDSAIGDQGGPLPPMRFEKTCFQGGFSGTHGHFSRLSFDGCPFSDGPAANSYPPVPTIDLSGAQLDRGLLLRSLAPKDPGHHLWVRARNARIAGPLNLSGSHLQSPKDDKDRRLASEPPVVAIDLHRATIEGDLTFLTGATSYGQIHARGVRIRGDIRMGGAQITVDAAEKFGLVLQSAVVDGMVMLYNRADAESDPVADRRPFKCSAGINLRAAEIGDDLHIEADYLGGNLNCLDLTVGNDLLLYTSIDREIDLSGCRIGGTLDLSRLTIRDEKGRLLLNNGTVQRILRLVRDDFDEKNPGAIPRSEFRMSGIVDLSGLTCDMLDDDVGSLWRENVQIKMHNFIYRQTGSRPTNTRKRRSNRIVGDWVSRRRADGERPWRWLPQGWLPGEQDFWETWQRRRNWIYQQFDSAETQAARADPTLSVSRHRIDGDDYHPQPFEQAIRVARTEGRDDFATNMEILKQRLEWRFFNEKVRWGLSIIGIILAALWLILKRDSIEWAGWIGLCLVVTIVAIVNTSKIHDFWKGIFPHRLSGEGRLEPRNGLWAFVASAFTWITYFLAPLLLYIHGWRHEPFYFVIALLIFGAARWLSVLAHAVMRVGFGYLRRPVYAICTLLGAFLLGWWGVRLANLNEMLVVDAEPVAAVVAPERVAGATAAQLYMGSENAAERGFMRDVPCGHLISEPLYALDTLIPLLDLREESRCEVRRLPQEGKVPPRAAEMRGLWGVITALPDLTVHNNAFWQGMKVIYAIAGWFIVSLSILTFAQVNRAHAEPPGEHK